MQLYPSFSQKQLLLAHILMASAVVIGVFFRFWGLGTSPLSVDEYYFSKAVFNILEKGIPLHEAGGSLYVRGLLQQYLTAGLMLFGGDMEWLLRLIPALSSLLCLPAVYLIGKRISGPMVACAATLLFSLSLWEIEFARFARMYAPFQAIFLWYVFFLMDAMTRGQRKSLIVAYGLALLSIYVYEASPFLLVLCFFPLFSEHRHKFWPFLAMPLLGFVLYYLHRKLGKYVGPPRLPQELLNHPNASIRFGILHPPLLLKHALGSGVWLALYLVPACISLYFLWQLLKQNSRLQLWSLFISAAIVSALLNLFGFAAMCIALGLVFLRQHRSTSPISVKTLMAIAACLVVSGLYWAGFGLLTDQWLGNVSNLDFEQHPGKLKQLISVLVNYPETLTRFLKPWLDAFPITTGILVLGVGAAFTAIILLPSTKDEVRYLFAIALAGILFISSIDTIQKSARYGFFFYPLLILLCCYGAFKVFDEFGKKFAIAGYSVFLAIFLWLGEDFSAQHLVDINEPQVMYRTQYSLKRGNLYYPRRDFQSPATFVSQHYQDGDVIISEVTVVDLYLDHPIQYLYLPMEQNRFWTRAVLEGTRDRWTNAKLIYRQSDLEQRLLNVEQRTWFINFSTDWMGEPAHHFRDLLPGKLQFSNQDDTIDVFLLEPNG